jgi:hypothetical protein
MAPLLGQMEPARCRRYKERNAVAAAKGLWGKSRSLGPSPSVLGMATVELGGPRRANSGQEAGDGWKV